MAALTHHGGRLDEAMARFPDAPKPWLDLSTGINPVAWIPRSSVIIDWARLPLPTALAELEASAAAFFGAAPEAVAAVPGSEIALRLLSRLNLPKPHRRIDPCYRTHAVALPDATATSIDVAWEGGGTILLANPNNPDGRIVERATLASMAEGRWLIVDEAFVDFDPSVSIIPDLPPRTIVLRSFGKFFGLAGVRLGFIVGPVDIVDRFRAMLGDWPVSAAAVAFGSKAYRDADWIAATRARLIDDARRLDDVLARHGLRPGGACPLFRLVPGASGWFDRLARSGILVRPFDYQPDWLRIGLPADDPALDRLDRALALG